MSLFDDHGQVLVITEAMQAEQTRRLNASIDKLAATALRIRDERDELLKALRAINLILLPDEPNGRASAESVERARRIAYAAIIKEGRL